MSLATGLLLIAIATVIIYFYALPQVPRRKVLDSELVPLQQGVQSVADVGDYAERSIMTNAFHKSGSASESIIRTNEAAAAKAIHDMNNIGRAENLGVSVQSLQQMEILRFQTNLQKELSILSAILTEWSETQRHVRQLEQRRQSHDLSTGTLQVTADLTEKLNRSSLDLEMERLHKAVTRKYDEALKRIDLLNIEAEAAAKRNKSRA